jgi:hypothetical protein
MKRVAAAILALGCISSSTTIAGESAAASASLTKAVGLQLQSSYAAARSRLLRSAWTADSTWGESGVHKRLAFQQYPEVLCGEGYQAVCTAKFEKNGTAILLTIDPKTKKLQVTSVDQD